MRGPVFYARTLAQSFHDPRGWDGGVYKIDVPNKGEEEAPKPEWKPTDIEFHQARLRCHQVVARDWQAMKVAMPELDWKILSSEQHSVAYAKRGDDEYLADLTNDALSG